MPRKTEPDHPREKASWLEAMAFCAWLPERLGMLSDCRRNALWHLAACSGQADFNHP
ncbi:MAG: hypothetical protein WAW61_21845 [Methylococcaceae bacterium]